MARISPSTEVLRALFARSGNQCAFPGCTQPLVNHKNNFIGQVCHIEAAMPGGERYNSSQSDDNRRNYNNLILLCYPHHIETDNVNEYPVETLISIKLKHEQAFQKSDFKIDESELYKLIHEMELFWCDVERLNKYEHSFSELAFEVDAKASGIDILDGANEAFCRIKELLDSFHNSDNRLSDDFSAIIQKKGIEPSTFSDIVYYENPFINRNWENHNLAVPNWTQSLQIYLVQIEVKYLEEYLKTNTNDLNAKNRLAQVKDTLRDLAQHVVHID